MNKKIMVCICFLIFFIIFITSLINSELSINSKTLDSDLNSDSELDFHTCDWKVDIIQNNDSVTYNYVCVKDYGNKDLPVSVNINL